MTLFTARPRPEIEWLTAAREALAQKDYDFAAKSADDALRRYAERPDLWQRDRGQGVENSVAMELLAVAVEAQVVRIQGLYDKGRFDEAAQEVRTVLDRETATLLHQIDHMGSDSIDAPGIELEGD